MPHVVLLGTLDTKLTEFKYLYQRLVSPDEYSLGSPKVDVTLIDCGRSPVEDNCITVTHSDLISRYGSDKTIEDMPRGEVVKYMSACTIKCVEALMQERPVHGIISAGGSGGSTLASEVMRAVAPMGMPKLLVSTIASGDVGSLVSEADITMMYSIVDIAGTNALLQNVLGNAAAAMVGMATSYEHLLGRPPPEQPKPRIGVTMFGVTTPGVDRIREYLESHGAEVYIFHATGHGGRAMERLVQEGKLDAVLDLTTTEICDHLFGGTMSAGPDRLQAAFAKGIPTIISVGATDMVNFGPRDTVPTKYAERQLLEHNSNVTLMRTTPDECAEIGRFITDKIRGAAKDPAKVQVWLPKGGVSMLAVAEGPFADTAADDALFQSLHKGLQGSGVQVVQDERHVNDQGFADAVAEGLLGLMYGDKQD